MKIGTRTLENPQRKQKKSPITQRDSAKLQELARRPIGRLSARFPLGLSQHDLGLDAGAGVNQVVAEEDFRGGSYLTNCIRGKRFREVPTVEKVDLPKVFHIRMCTDSFYNPDSKDDSSVIDILGESE